MGFSATNSALPGKSSLAASTGLFGVFAAGAQLTQVEVSTFSYSSIMGREFGAVHHGMAFCITKFTM